MKNSLGYAIIGTGMISRFHVKALQNIPQAKLICVYDKNLSSAERFGNEFQVPYYTSFEELLENPDVDVVTICTPSGLRENFAIQAAAAKKHVVCEKPMEITPHRIDKMIKACRDNQVTLTGIFNNRYNEVFRTLKKAVDNGAFGRLILGDVYVKWFRDESYYENSTWKGTWAFDGGGALMNQSIHFIDLLQWIMGPVKSIKAFASTRLHKIEVEDTAVGILTFSNGALGVIEGTTAAVPGLYDRLEIHGENGSVLIENGKILSWQLPNFPLSEEKKHQLNAYNLGSSKNPSAIDFRMHQLQLEEITNCILHGQVPSLCGEEAKKSVEIISAIYKDAGICCKSESLI